jgi:hypothetical protein
VYAFTAPSEFADEESKQRVDSLKDLVTRLKKKNKTIALVGSRDAATHRAIQRQSLLLGASAGLSLSRNEIVTKHRSSTTLSDA